MRRRRPAGFLLLPATLALVALVALAGCTPQPRPVEVSLWLTTPDETSLLEQQPSIDFVPAPDDDSGDDADTDSRTNGQGDASGDEAPTTIEVSPGERSQSMVGFGASLTDSSAWLLANSPDRDATMTALFDPNDGIGLSFLRQPVGASDFSRSFYTYDDVAPGDNDEGFARFSIAHDEEYILPVVRQALELNPDITVMATPWSAPAWLKDNGSLIGGGLPETSSAQYADYLVRFLQDYRDAGVPVAYLSVQNEPAFTPEGYPGMLLSAPEEGALIAATARKIAAAGLDTRILGWDHNWDQAEYPFALLAHDTDGAVAGTAWHCYRGEPTAQSQVQRAFPDSDVFLTECSGTQSADVRDTFAHTLAWQAENILIGAVRHGSRTVTTWNMALDAAGGPVIGSCSSCTGVVTVDGAEVSFNAEYYVLGHASAFVRPGAERIGSRGTASDIHHVAFQNTDGSIALVVHNGDRDAARPVRIEWAGRAATSTLPPGALATFTWIPGDSISEP